MRYTTRRRLCLKLSSRCHKKLTADEIDIWGLSIDIRSSSTRVWSGLFPKRRANSRRLRGV